MLRTPASDQSATHLLAEMTIPNGNVYYEVGVRHACKGRGCVLLAADWSRQFFDVAQLRTVRYPLPSAELDDAAVKQIVATIVKGVPAMAEGDSPVYQVLPKYPGDVDVQRATSMRKQLTALSEFQSRMSGIRNAPREQRETLAAALSEEYGPRRPMPAAVGHGLLKLFQHLGAWQRILDLAVKLPGDLAVQSDVIELTNLAKSKLGNHSEAIGALEALIKTSGPTSERFGLLGGRYKRLWSEANGADKVRYLNKAIESYESGMMLDLNDYYPSSNLPRLYLARGLKADAEKARTTAQLVYFACKRAKERNAADEWLRPTLLGSAFDAADVSAAETLHDEIVQEGPAAWRLKVTLDDIEPGLARVTDVDTRAALQAIVDRLRALL